MAVELRESRQVNLRTGSIVMAALVAGSIVVVTLLLATMREPTSPQLRTAKGGSVEIEEPRAVPQVFSDRQVRFFAKHGASGAEIARINLDAWEEIEAQMLADPWVIGLGRHRPGTDPSDLYGVWRHRGRG